MNDVKQMRTAHCCGECGVEGDARLKTCKSCMQAKYCNAICQKNHWPKHKKQCKLRATELRDEALFNDPPPKEDCPICFLPMPAKLICCVSLPPATISSVPIYNLAIANEEFQLADMEKYYSCCGKTICAGCVHSCRQSGNHKCPYCNADQASKTEEEDNEDLMKRVAVNDPVSICILAGFYHHGLNGFQQDHAKAKELYTRAADLGYNDAHSSLGDIYHEGGDMKKTKFHWEAAAMAGNEVARYNLGALEYDSGNKERGVKHWIIAASAGEFNAMNDLRIGFEKGYVSRESINSTLVAYNNSCAEMRNEARGAYMRRFY